MECYYLAIFDTGNRWSSSIRFVVAVWNFNCFRTSTHKNIRCTFISREVSSYKGAYYISLSLGLVSYFYGERKNITQQKKQESLIPQTEMDQALTVWSIGKASTSPLYSVILSWIISTLVSYVRELYCSLVFQLKYSVHSMFVPDIYIAARLSQTKGMGAIGELKFLPRIEIIILSSNTSIHMDLYYVSTEVKYATDFFMTSSI